MTDIVVDNARGLTPVFARPSLWRFDVNTTTSVLCPLRLSWQRRTAAKFPSETLAESMEVGSYLHAESKSGETSTLFQRPRQKIWSDSIVLISWSIPRSKESWRVVLDSYEWHYHPKRYHIVWFWSSTVVKSISPGRRSLLAGQHAAHTFWTENTVLLHILQATYRAAEGFSTSKINKRSTVKTKPRFGECYACFGCETKTGVVRILVTFQDRPIFSNII